MKRSLSTVAAVALMATTASAETRYATITHIKPNYQEVTSNQPVNICSDVEVPIYGNVQGGGASGGDVLTGMIIGGLLGKGATGKDNGAAAGAVIGGIIAADKGNQSKRVITGYKIERQCRQENRYTTSTQIKNYRITYQWDGISARSYTYNKYNVGDRIPVSVSIVAQ